MEDKIQAEDRLKSDDAHVVALAIVSGARLLYSKDVDLHEDFKNSKIISDPRGKVYSTYQSGEFRGAHRKLLARRDLCRMAAR